MVKQEECKCMCEEQNRFKCLGMVMFVTLAFYRLCRFCIERFKEETQDLDDDLAPEFLYV